VIGGGIVGPHAGDLIAEVALAIEMGCEAATSGTPSTRTRPCRKRSAMAAEVFEGTITDLYIPVVVAVAIALEAWRLPPLPMLAGLVAGLLAYHVALQVLSSNRLNRDKR
jgi:hypothetical protein